MLSCPFPFKDYPHITSAHGAGGRLTEALIQGIFRPAFGEGSDGHDGAVRAAPGQIAVSTDAFVVQPLFFPGGDIGKLAVYGTANDLAMCGAKPLYLTCAFVLEEGLPTEILARVAQSAGEAARSLGIEIVAGDTKVVERGRADGLYLCSTGIGAVVTRTSVHPESVRSGDAVLLSGDIGRHGMAVMAHRHKLAMGFPLESDCAPLVAPVLALIDAGLEVRCLRDLTRGGLATAVAELAEQSGLDWEVDESVVPITEAVQGACEMLGIDPLYVANEGRFVAVVPEAQADRALEVLRACPVSAGAVRLGTVGTKTQAKARIRARTVFGTFRIWDRLAGDPLPRIC